MKYFHSTAGTRISALGNAGEPSGLIRPLMWSPWKCEMMTVSTLSRSMPAAFRLLWNWPLTPLLRSKLASPVPVSTTMSLEPVLMTIGVYGIVIMLVFHVSGEQRLVHLVLLDVERRRCRAA